MMLVTLVAILCHALGGTPLCVEEIVTDSNMDARLNWMSCQVQAQGGIAEWLKANPKYHDWTLQSWKCVPGHYETAKRA